MSNEVLENIKSRRSVRTYTEQQVSAGDLNLILEAAAYAPSGMNFQTWQCCVHIIYITGFTEN